MTSDNFYTHRLPNGLQLLGQYMPDMQSASACFWVVTGARDEPSDLMGVSHFLEHMTFKGTPTRTYEDINNDFVAMGAENNAGTSWEFTYFYAKVLRERVHDLVALLADMMHPRLDADDFLQERQVILEEIARYEDMPDSQLLYGLWEAYFQGHPLRHRVLGTTETISAMTIEQMRAYWERRYAANNMIFAIAGNFEWEVVRAQVEQLCSGWRQGEQGRARSAVTPQPQMIIRSRPSMAQQMLGIAMTGVSESDPDRYVAEVVGTILGDSAGSRLFWGVREAGLADEVGAGFFTLDGMGLLMASATTQPEKMGAALAAMRREIALLESDGVRPDELERAKIKLASSVVMEGESTNRRMSSLVGSWLAIGKLEMLHEVEEAIYRVTVEDCARFLRRVTPTAAQVTMTLGPLSDADAQAQIG